jgi:hypothetical protein
VQILSGAEGIFFYLLHDNRYHNTMNNRKSCQTAYFSGASASHFLFVFNPNEIKIDALIFDPLLIITYFWFTSGNPVSFAFFRCVVRVDITEKR